MYMNQSLFTLFDDTFSLARRQPSLPSAYSFGYARRTQVVDDNLVIEFDLPGVKREYVTVTTTRNSLRIVVDVKDRKFDTSYTVSENFALDSATATMADGVLKITIAPVASNKIEIR